MDWETPCGRGRIFRDPLLGGGFFATVDGAPVMFPDGKRRAWWTVLASAQRDVAAQIESQPPELAAKGDA